jgi:uncharacterized Fe-S center protein
MNAVLGAVDLSRMFRSNDHTAVKLSFGEWGNLNYIRPQYFTVILDHLKQMDVLPFLTDTNTLYKGMRTNSISHLKNAVMNGFGYESMQVPVIIADGLKGQNYVEVAINGEVLSSAKIASDIYYADSLLCVSHFKLHDLAGFGASIKNLGMGCAAKAGKAEQHSDLKPLINMRCVGCGECLKVCNSDAIAISGKAKIKGNQCMGCCLCLLVCKHNAIKTNWDTKGSRFIYKLIEYASGAIDNKKGKCLFINFMTNITPTCDCVNYTPSPLIEDCGILISEDPIACDKACMDIFIEKVKEQEHIIFCHKNVQIIMEEEATWQIQFQYAEKIGLGSMDYDLITILNNGKQKNMNRLTGFLN